MNQEPSPHDTKAEGILEKLANWKLPDISPGCELVLPLKKKPDTDFLELGHWLNIIRHPSTVLILGARGNGKSALGYKILEYLRYTADIYVVSLPQKARRLLPEWIGNVPSIEDIPQNSLGLIDESYTLFHSRTSSSDRARTLSN